MSSPGEVGPIRQAEATLSKTNVPTPSGEGLSYKSKAGQLLPYKSTIGSITRIKRIRCTYNAMTALGASGSPVVLQTDGLPVVAMHRAGTEGCPGEGILMSAVLRDIAHAIKQNPSIAPPPHLQVDG